MKVAWLRAGILFGAAAVACGGVLAQPKSDWEIKMETRDWQEGEVKVPEFPKPENLVEFEASKTSRFRFFIDATSIIAGSDGAVRYTLVARSPSGTENVSFNGLRCKTSAHKLYANGRSDRTWSPVAAGEWKDLRKQVDKRQHIILMQDFFCPAGIPIASRDEGIDALRRGIHPHATTNQTNFTR